jgi:hypothetical protein
VISPVRSRRRRWRLATLVVLVLAAGCGSKGKERREAERVETQIERIGLASPAEREPLIAALENERYENPRVEKVRLECAAAYRALHTVQVALANVPADPIQAAEQLQISKAASDAAKGAHERCQTARKAMRDALGVT